MTIAFLAWHDTLHLQDDYGFKGTISNSCHFFSDLVGGSIANADEDISPYATFHLLGMREENKNGGINPQNFKTLQPNHGAGGPPPMMPPPGPQTGPNTPAHQRHMSQTMHVS